MLDYMYAVTVDDIGELGVGLNVCCVGLYVLEDDVRLCVGSCVDSCVDSCIDGCTIHSPPILFKFI